MTLSELSQALDAIEAQEPEAVYAGRPGHTVGHNTRGQSIIFRREFGIIVAELWRHSVSSGPVKKVPLTPKLAARAAALMDR